MADSTAASSAAVADGSERATTKQVVAESGKKEGIFSMCDDAKLEKFKTTGKSRLKLLINNNAGNFYKLPERIVDNDLTGHRPTSIAKAITELNEHLLSFIVPGQIMMLDKEDQLERDMSQVKSVLNLILDQMTYNTENEKRMDAKIKEMTDSRAHQDQENTRIIEELKSEVKKANNEITKLRNDLWMDNQTDRGQRRGNNDQRLSDQGLDRGRGRGRGCGGRGGNYSGPNGSQRHQDPAHIPHVPGGGADFDPNSSSNKYFTDRQGRAPSQRREQAEANTGDTVNTENNADEGIGWPDDDIEGHANHINNENNKGQNNSGNRGPPLTKRQMSFAKELIVHGVSSQTIPETFENEEDKKAFEEKYKAKESEILYEVFEELSPKHLGPSFGVVIDIEKDIDYSDRFTRHVDEIKHCRAPIRVRFFTIKKCKQVLRAAKRAECLKGRRPSYYGKYAIPRKYDRSGNLNVKAEAEAAEIAASRPIFYFRPSIPYEERKRKIDEKAERIEKKKDPANIKFAEQRKQTLDFRVRFGTARNFGKSTADTASKEALEENEKRIKELSDAKAAKDKEKAENLKLNEINYPGIKTKNPFDPLKGQNKIDKTKKVMSQTGSANNEAAGLLPVGPTIAEV